MSETLCIDCLYNQDADVLPAVFVHQGDAVCRYHAEERSELIRKARS